MVLLNISLRTNQSLTVSDICLGDTWWCVHLDDRLLSSDVVKHWDIFQPTFCQSPLAVSLQLWSSLPTPSFIWYHRDQFSHPSLLQSSSMQASSREPTGLPRTPGNPGRPWRGWKAGGWQEGGGWRTVLEEGKQTKQTRKWTEIRHMRRERGSERVRCQPRSCKRLLSKNLWSLGPRGGKQSSISLVLAAKPVIFSKDQA